MGRGARVVRLDWRDELNVGDVVKTGYGAFRVVREAVYWTQAGQRRLHVVTFAIRRCSWTRRCYTCINRSDLRTMGYRKVRVRRRRLQARIDRAIVASIHQPSKDPYILTCCDVEGIA